MELCSQRAVGVACLLQHCKHLSAVMVVLWEDREFCGKWPESHSWKGGLQINLTKSLQCLCWMLSFSRLSREQHSAHNQNAYYFFFLGSMKCSPTRTPGSRSNVTPPHAPCWWYHITQGSRWSSEPAYKGSGKCYWKADSMARCCMGMTPSISS